MFSFIMIMFCIFIVIFAILACASLVLIGVMFISGLKNIVSAHRHKDDYDFDEDEDEEDDDDT